MPYISFLWSPAAGSGRVFGIADALRTIADAHDISFYVNAKEGRGRGSAGHRERRCNVPDAAVELLRRLGTKTGVTIYVHAGSCEP